MGKQYFMHFSYMKHFFRMNVFRYSTNKQKIMKKNTRSLLIVMALCIGSILSACHNNSQPAAEQSTQDTTQHAKPESSSHDTVGTGTWTVTILVEGSKGEPFSGATVSAPCTGWPAKTTDATGKAQFSGSGTCPCAAAQATVTTPKGCNQKINVSCDSMYTVVCTQ